MSACTDPAPCAVSAPGRALHNIAMQKFNGSSPEASGLNCFSPNVNLYRDPRCVPFAATALPVLEGVMCRGVGVRQRLGVMTGVYFLFVISVGELVARRGRCPRGM